MCYYRINCHTGAARSATAGPWVTVALLVGSVFFVFFSYLSQLGAEQRVLSLYFLQRRKFLTSGCLSQLFQFSRPRGDSAVNAVSPVVANPGTMAGTR